MPRYPGGIWHGDQGPLPPPKVLKEAEDDGAGGWVLRGTLLQRERGHPERPTVTHYFNVVVDTVVRHWEPLVVEREGGDSSGGKGDGT